jgi:hypothetical protein
MIAGTIGYGSLHFPYVGIHAWQIVYISQCFSRGYAAALGTERHRTAQIGKSTRGPDVERVPRLFAGNAASR